jgi:hypothetical protein
VAAASTLGIDVYMMVGGFVLSMLPDVTPSNMPREMQLAHATFVASALDLMAQPREVPFVIENGVNKGFLDSLPEQTLAQNARALLVDACLCTGMDGEALSLMVDAWRRVERSGVLVMRLLEDERVLTKCLDEGFDAAAAEAAVRGLRECALAGCGAREMHVAQFKRCAACKGIVYCCKEHQVADWPAHKTACKAARKTSSK